MTRPIPAFPSLEHDRKEARALLKAVRRGEAAVINRLQSIHPILKHCGAGTISPREVRLADLQWMLALEYGFPSWRAWSQHVKCLTQDRDARLKERYDTILKGSLQRALQVISSEPEFCRFDLFTAALTGEPEVVQRELERDAEAAKAVGGPNDWPALLYLSFSRLLRDPARREAMLTCARLLLAAGADPNAHYWEPEYPDLPETALYGATGVNDCPELARILLEAGARVDDVEAFYHSCEHPTVDCLAVLCEFGGSPRGSNTILRSLDFPNLEAVRWLLDHGADPDERHPGAVYHAVLRGRAPEFIRLLAERGAKVGLAPFGGPSVYRLAYRRGMTAVAQTLAELGANTEVTTADRFLNCCSRADEPGARAILEQAPDLVSNLPPGDLRLLADKADDGDLAAVQLTLSLGWPVDAEGDWKGTALHHAAFWGEADIVQLLVAHGASLTVRHGFNGTALSTAIFGSENCRTRTGGVAPGGDPDAATHGDYPRVVEILLDAGAPLPESDGGNGRVKEVLRLRRAAA